MRDSAFASLRAVTNQPSPGHGSLSGDVDVHPGLLSSGRDSDRLLYGLLRAKTRLEHCSSRSAWSGTLQGLSGSCDPSWRSDLRRRSSKRCSCPLSLQTCRLTAPFCSNAWAWLRQPPRKQRSTQHTGRAPCPRGPLQGKGPTCLSLCKLSTDHAHAMHVPLSLVIS